jgi:hypothetical protein
MPATAQLPIYIQGRWCPSANSEYLAVTNPETL